MAGGRICRAFCGGLDLQSIFNSTKAGMKTLLQVLFVTLVGADPVFHFPGKALSENLVVVVDNPSAQSIIRAISRWVVEGGRAFLALSTNPDTVRVPYGWFLVD